MFVQTISTTHANSFVVVSNVETRVAVEFKVTHLPIASVTITVRSSPFPDKKIGHTFSEDSKESIHISSSATVAQWRRVARLARIAVDEIEIFELCTQLNSIMSFVTQLNEADVTGVEPMTSVTPMAMKMRKDEVTDGGIADAIMANAPAREDHFFLVPKVVE